MINERNIQHIYDIIKRIFNFIFKLIMAIPRIILPTIKLQLPVNGIKPAVKR